MGKHFPPLPPASCCQSMSRCRPLRNPPAFACTQLYPQPHPPTALHKSYLTANPLPSTRSRSRWNAFWAPSLPPLLYSLPILALHRRCYYSVVIPLPLPSPSGPGRTRVGHLPRHAVWSAAPGGQGAGARHGPHRRHQVGACVLGCVRVWWRLWCCVVCGTWWTGSGGTSWAA